MAGSEFRGENFIVRLKIREYSSEYEDFATLTAIAESSISNLQKVLITEDNNVYRYEVDATTGDYAPDDQTEDTGFWVLVEDGSYMDFSNLQKVEAHFVLEELNESVLKFSNVSQEDYKDMEMLDNYTARMVVEDYESEEFEPGEYILEVHKYLADTRFESGYKLEKQKIRLFTLYDAVR